MLCNLLVSHIYKGVSKMIIVTKMCIQHITHCYLRRQQAAPLRPARLAARVRRHGDGGKRLHGSDPTGQRLVRLSVRV